MTIVQYERHHVHHEAIKKKYLKLFLTNPQNVLRIRLHYTMKNTLYSKILVLGRSFALKFDKIPCLWWCNCWSISHLEILVLGRKYLKKFTKFLLIRWFGVYHKEKSLFWVEIFWKFWQKPLFVMDFGVKTPMFHYCFGHWFIVIIKKDKRLLFIFNNGSVLS